MAKIIIPTPLRKFTGNQTQLNAGGSTVKEAISELVKHHEALQKHLLDEAGHLRSFIRIYVGDEDIRNLHQESTAINENSIISIVPAIAGGMN